MNEFNKEQYFQEVLAVLKRLNIDISQSKHYDVFKLHMLSLIDRLAQQEQVELPKENHELIQDEISTETDRVTNEIVTLINDYRFATMNDTERLLIATHIQNYFNEKEE